MEKITAYNLKTAILSYFRFKRQMLCATEVHVGLGYMGDVVAINKKDEVLEIEVKISLSDLKNEQRHKKEKHSALVQESRAKVNYYYIAITSELYEKAKPEIEALSPKYGIITWHRCSNPKMQNSEFEVNIMKRPTKLTSKIFPEYRKNIAKRASSELINLHRKMLKVNGWNILRDQTKSVLRS